MQPRTKLYLLISVSLLLAALIIISPYRNLLNTLQASTNAEHTFLPIILQDGIGPLGQTTTSPQVIHTLVPTTTMIASTATPTIHPSTVPPTATLVPYDLLQRIDVGPFIFHASDDMVEIDVQGIDSLVKKYKNSQMVISIDYGWYSGYSPHPSEITLTIDGFDAIYNTQDGHSSMGYKYYSNILFENVVLSNPPDHLGMYIRSNREDAAEVALAVFNTIDFPHEAGEYPLDKQIDVGPLTFSSFEYTRELVEAREHDPLVRVYHDYRIEIIVSYGDSLSYIPDDSEEALTIDGLEAMYYTREADSESRYEYYSTVYFEKSSTSESSESCIMEIYSDREDAVEAALAIFNTIKFTGMEATDTPQPEANPTATPIPDNRG